MRVETYGNEQKRIDEPAPAKKACHICHGMGGIEKGNGDVIDCPNRKCENGFVTIKKD